MRLFGVLLQILDRHCVSNFFHIWRNFLHYNYILEFFQELDSIIWREIWIFGFFQISTNRCLKIFYISSIDSWWYKFCTGFQISIYGSLVISIFAVEIIYQIFLSRYISLFSSRFPVQDLTQTEISIYRSVVNLITSGK